MLKNFTATNIKTAMELIKSELGENAVIVTSQESEDGKSIIVTAATEDEFQKIHRNTYSVTTDSKILDDIADILHFHGVPSEISEEIIKIAQYICLQGQDMATDMIRLMAACFSYSPLNLQQENSIFMLVGAPGTGKTMTVAKMASLLVMQNINPIVITTDNKKAGGVEQLASFTNILGLELHIADNKNELQNLLQKLASNNNLLIDSGGINPYNEIELNEVAEYIALNKNIEPILTIAAGCDSAEAQDMTKCFANLGVKRLLVTRIDAARRYGSIISSAFGSKLSLANASNSSKIIGEFIEFNPANLAGLLLNHTRYINE
jgi:flagellar biosynthesis protein FlhF